jgi:Flp pilus assembly protein TadG
MKITTPHRNRRRFPSLRSERGQTLAEFAIVVPVLLMLVMAILQFGLVFRDYITLTDATRAGARRGAVARNEPDPKGATEAAVKKSASGLPGDLQVTVDAAAGWVPGADVKVTATYPYSIDILGVLIQSGLLHSTTTERIE